jgi:hypothetical protein
MTRCGLPHSDIPGSKLVCSSPGLIAACHVLHRLLAPRHSPYTLSSLTIRNSKLTLTNCLHNQLVCDSSMCKHCVCLWSEKTTVCRIFSCQRAVLNGGQTPMPPGSLTCGGPLPRAARSPRSLFPRNSEVATKSVYVGGRLGAPLILQRSLRTLSPQQPNNGADVGCSEPEGPAARRNSFVK